MTASSQTIDESLLHHSKNRIVAVDISRIMAALAVMTHHLVRYGFDGAGISHLASGAIYHTFGSPTAIFLFLAGYFACRNITWKKALNNAWWSFAPFVLWNCIAIAVDWWRGALPEDATWRTLFGCARFIIPEWGFLGSSANAIPCNVPLWFMRDLVFLFLISPILSKCAKYLFPALVLASLVPGLSYYFEHDSGIAWVMSPYTIAFFTAGCALRSLRKETQTAFLQYYSPVVIALVMCLFWGGRTIEYCVEAGWLPESFLVVSEVPNLVEKMLKAWVLYQVARWIEVKIPLATPFALKFAPVTFLTFATHEILYRFLPQEGVPGVLYPFLVFALMAVFFFSLKRWCRPLLHLVAHYKLRPDDLEPKAASKKSKKSETVAG